MATLSDLVSVVAGVTGLPEATVFAYGRFAREAGLISQAGRGRGGAQMTVTDATNLLLAVCGTRVTRDAGKAIRALRPLAGEIYVGVNDDRTSLQLKQWMNRYSSFAFSKIGTSQIQMGIFVDYLLTDTSTGMFEEVIRSLKIYDVPRAGDPKFYEANEIYNKNKLLLPIKAPKEIDLFDSIDVSLSINSSLNQGHFDVNYNKVFGFDHLTVNFGKSGWTPTVSDLDTESSISQRTLFAVGECLGQRGQTTGSFEEPAAAGVKRGS